MLGWIRPCGVAPARMPKAEATTGLAPKKASAQRPSGRPPVRRVSFLNWTCLLSWVKSQSCGGLGRVNAKIAGLLWPGVLRGLG